MSNRLESLNSKKPLLATPKPLLKFKPKAVARKSKEERAKNAPSIKQEPTPRPPRGRGSTHGRGRGGRDAFAGTHVVSAGPLAAGSVSMGNANGTKMGLSNDKVYGSLSPSLDFLLKLKLKDGVKTRLDAPGALGHTVAEPDSDEEDPSRINMNKEYRFADEETILFPVRPQRNSEALSDSHQSREPTAEPVDSVSPSRESPLKSEPPEEKLQKIMHDKEELEARLAVPVDFMDQEEYNMLLDDHQAIVDLLSAEMQHLGSENTESVKLESPEPVNDKYVLFQLPQVLPLYRQDAQEEQARSALAGDGTSLRGQVGHLNIHQSGRVTINLGNDNVLEVSQGVPAGFLQELAVVEVTEKKEDEMEVTDENGLQVRGNIFRLGQLDQKIIATPALI